MSSEGTALALQRLLEEEGAIIHSALRARMLPSMGGGMGVVLTERLPAGTTLARFPFCSMITAPKARFNLAMAEVAVDLAERRTRDPRACASDSTDTSASTKEQPDTLPVIPFASRIWSTHEFESQIRSAKLRHTIKAKEEELKAALDSTEAIVCYIILMAALYGRWTSCTSPDGAYSIDSAEDRRQSSELGCTIVCRDDTKAPPRTLRYTHENAWMRTWIHALPAQYDNLLELCPLQADRCGASNEESVSPAPVPPAASPPTLALSMPYATSPCWLRQYVSLQRFRSCVMREQHSIERRYTKCCAALRCLQRLPEGAEATAPAGTAATCKGEVMREETSESPACPSEYVAHGAAGSPRHSSPPRRCGPCTLGQFLWAFNTLMSRGFYFPEETWAMMPFVDYFNYAVQSNGTMNPQEDDPDDPECFTNALLSRSGRENGGDSGTRMRRVTPHRKQRRTGLRSVRVGAGSVPRENFHVYEFQLKAPLHAVNEQVMLHYGFYSDVELLLWYGFTLRPSLLPVSSAPVEGEGHCGGLVPSLPPDLEDTGDSAARTARALQHLLPRVVRAVTRVEYYRQWVSSCTSGAEGSTADEEDDYQTWCTALNWAYRVPLSPLADAEGNYTAAEPGTTWLDELLRTFLETPAWIAPLEQCSPDDEAAYRVDTWMRQWSAERWPAVAASAFPCIQKGCAFGVLGPSTALQTALHVCVQASSNRQDILDSTERHFLVRGIAWAELYVNMIAVSSSASPASSSQRSLSNAAAEHARTVSVDHWVLLRFLSLTCSDSELEEYIEFESDGV